MKPSIVFAGACVALLFAAVAPARAARLDYVSDTIGDSRPALPTNHAIMMNVPGGVPASGKIVVNFENGAFPIDPSFGYADVALSVSTTSPSSGFVARPLAAAATGADDGVAVSGTTGPITITLASGSAIPAGAYVRIALGTGGYQVSNPTSTASYRILLNTYDAGGAAIDYGAAMVAILPAIGTALNQTRVLPATLSGGLPTGTIPSNVSAVVVSFDTDVYATCRYATSSGVSYDAMTNSFDHSLTATFQYTTISNITKGTTYDFYARCQDFTGNQNTSDYLISFTAGDPTGTGSGGGTNGGPAAPPGTPSGGGGGGAPYPPGPSTPSLYIRGVSMPNVSISVLEDGAALPGAATMADASGNFFVNIPSLPQGTYSFTLVENDAGRAIASYTATITVIAGTTNSITNILLPPDISFQTSTIALGATTTVSGLAPPSSAVEVWVTSQSGAQNAIKGVVSADAQGAWSYELDTKGFAIDTYQVKARATLPQYTASSFSGISYLGVGTAAAPRGKGDLNGDGKVNLVDFSILLFHWGQNYAIADLNGDGTIDLPDLSILLFNWSG